jgi:hypothetical protein
MRFFVICYVPHSFAMHYNALQREAIYALRSASFMQSNDSARMQCAAAVSRDALLVLHRDAMTWNAMRYGCATLQV